MRDPKHQFVTTDNPEPPKQCLTLFRRLFESSNNPICTCQSYNRNSNAFTSDSESQPEQLYPHIRKVYNSDTDLLEHVYITMSTTKPDPSSKEREEKVITPRRARVSKQRAKVLITEYCTRKIVDNIKVSANKRNYSSLCFFFGRSNTTRSEENADDRIQFSFILLKRKEKVRL